MAAVAQGKEKMAIDGEGKENVSSDTSLVEPIMVSQSQPESEEEALNYLNTLGLSANNGNAESSVNSVPAILSRIIEHSPMA